MVNIRIKQSLNSVWTELVKKHNFQFYLSDAADTLKFNIKATKLI